MTAPAFLEPIEFNKRGVLARNRVLLPAMTNRQSHEDGTLGDDELRWLRSRAKGGFGIVTTCAAHVSEDGKGFAGQLGIFDDRLLPGLRTLASALSSEGAVALAQLYHGGVRSSRSLTGEQPWSASEFELSFAGFERPRAATTEDIERLIANFVAAAVRAQEAGFHGVEIHGAHGYLLTQFLGTITNTRTDAWGGSLARRAHLLREILRQCRTATDESFIVGVRISPEVADQGVDLDDSLQVAKWLVEDGVDFLHVSNWDSFKAPQKYTESKKMLTTYFREAVGPDALLVATGSIWTVDDALSVMQQGADLIGVGRAAICNPSWPIDAAEEGWQPERPPMSARQLAERALSPTFIDYMQRWPGFVASANF